MDKNNIHSFGTQGNIFLLFDIVYCTHMDNPVNHWPQNAKTADKDKMYNQYRYVQNLIIFSMCARVEIRTHNQLYSPLTTPAQNKSDLSHRVSE